MPSIHLRGPSARTSGLPTSGSEHFPRRCDRVRASNAEPETGQQYAPATEALVRGIHAKHSELRACGDGYPLRTHAFTPCFLTRAQVRGIEKSDLMTRFRCSFALATPRPMIFAANGGGFLSTDVGPGSCCRQSRRPVFCHHERRKGWCRDRPLRLARCPSLGTIRRWSMD